jgi:hypothetical protein
MQRHVRVPENIRLCMISFSQEQKLLICLFPAEHTRLPSAQHSCLNDIQRQQDEGVNISSPGLFHYTAGMSCMVLANVCSLR